MASYTTCEKTASSLGKKEIRQLIEKLAHQFDDHWKHYDFTEVNWRMAIKGDDSLAYWLQENFNVFVHHCCATEEDERSLRFTLAIEYVGNYLSSQTWTDEKFERCALWRWMVCMGRHTAQDRHNARTVASLTEAQIYCRAMIYTLGLDWTLDQLNRACKSYVELNQRR